jgi:hypothetical protein
MTTLQLTSKQAFEWIERAIELGKYDVARGILEDVIKSRIAEMNKNNRI